MRRPGNLNGTTKMRARATLGSLGQYGYSLPKGNYGLASEIRYCCGEWFPGISDGNAMAAAAQKENSEITVKIEASLAKAQAAGDTATAQEIQNILTELKALDQAVRAEKPPYPDAPLTLAYRKALKLVDDLAMWIKTPAAAPVASASANVTSSLNVPLTNGGGSLPTVSSDSSKTIMLIGGIGLGLLTLLMVARILRKKKPAVTPAARRRKRKS